jgi:hypothetical protein
MLVAMKDGNLTSRNEKMMQPTNNHLATLNGITTQPFVEEELQLF